MLDTYFSTDSETYSKEVESDIDAFSTTVQNQGNVVSFKKTKTILMKKELLSYINITVDKLIPMAAAACLDLLFLHIFLTVWIIFHLKIIIMSTMRDLSNSEVFYEKVITDVITLKKNNFSADNDYLTNVLWEDAFLCKRLPQWMVM